MTFGIDLLGYIGGSIIASSMPLQVYQSWKRGSTCDISWKWLSGYVTGITLLFIYAHLQNIPPVWGPLCLEISSTFVLILLKIKFDIIEHKIYSSECSTQTDNEINKNQESLHNGHEKVLFSQINNENNSENDHKYKLIEISMGSENLV